NQADILRIDPEHRMRDLRQRCLHALPMRVRADAQLQYAVGSEPRRALLVARYHRDAPAVVDRGSVRGLLAVDREADADSLLALLRAICLELANCGYVDHRCRAPDRLRIVAAVEMLLRDVVVRHLL